MKPSLVILAAGIGSRYGGLKQIDPVGPGGEIVMDYSVFDAIRAGFGKVVFVLRRELEQPFRETILRRFEDRIDVRIAFQEPPAGRQRPYGTGHALLCAAGEVAEPCGVINADDFYGATTFQRLGNYLCKAHDGARADYCMVAFVLRQTLSEHGAVSRGVCACDATGYLQHITEITDIRDPTSKNLTGDEPVSLNTWGFTPSIFDHLRAHFEDFRKTRGHEEKSELFLPAVVDALVKAGRADVKVLRTPDAWFGVTYPQDKAYVMAGVRGLVRQGKYPERLWDGNIER
ncbi:MAG: nucleotidyltransferase [bacterium]